MNLNFLTLVNQHPPYGIFMVMQFQKWQLAYLFCPNYEANQWLTALDTNGLRVCSWWHKHQLSRTPLHCFCSISIINLILPILILLSWIYSPTLLENLKLHNEALLLILKGKISRFFLWWRSDSFYWSFKNTRRCDASHTVYFLLNGKLPYCRARVSVEKSGNSSSRKDSSTNFWWELSLCFLIWWELCFLISSVGTQA